MGGFEQRITVRKDTRVSDRREFLKTAGLLGLAPWSRAVSSTTREILPLSRADDTKARKESSPANESIILEMRLEITSAGVARSLIHKASGQECLMQDLDIPMFNVTQYRPYDNELQL